MNENIKVLLDKVAGDEELLAKFSACKSVDEAFDLARELVGGFTKEEFVEAMTALSAADEGDISDEDLTAAAGGSVSEAVSQVKDSIVDTYNKVTNSINKVSEAVSNSVFDSAKVVSKSIGKSMTEVIKSIGDAPSAVTNSVTKSVSEVSKSVTKSLNKVSKALAI